MIVNSKNSKGFTIIELLIVVVVIGILALLVLNTFGSAQDRAKNATTIANAKAYQTALIAYMTDNGQYPPTAATNNCLGLGHIDLGGSSTGDCYSNAAGTSFISENAAFNDLIAPYIGATEPVSTEVHNYGQIYQGAMYENWPAHTLNGTPHAHYLTYAVSGF